MHTLENNSILVISQLSVLHDFWDWDKELFDKFHEVKVRGMYSIQSYGKIVKSKFQPPIKIHKFSNKKKLFPTMKEIVSNHEDE